MGMELAKALVDRIQSAPAMRAGRGSTAEGETHVQECVVVPMVLVEIEMQDPCVSASQVGQAGDAKCVIKTCVTVNCVMGMEGALKDELGVDHLLPSVFARKASWETIARTKKSSLRRRRHRGLEASRMETVHM